MRARRSLLVIVTMGSLLALPADAAANGGAYIDFDRTHYLPGDGGVATTDVRIPEKRRSLLDEGPFYLLLLRRGTELRRGAPLPAGAIPVAPIEVEHLQGARYELNARFVMPEIASGYYEMRVCNDPCTVDGFREVLTGSVSVVATRREAQLLVENDRLRGRLFGFRREARRAERELEATEAELETQLAFASDERARLTGEIDRLERRLASARRQLAAGSRPPFDPWLVGAILVVTAAAAFLVFRRRRSSTPLLSLDSFETLDEEVSANGRGRGSGTPEEPAVRMHVDRV
jgi:hypothetical protein